MAETDSVHFDHAERERMASMLEKWFQRRMSLSNRAFKLIFIPLAAVFVFAGVFWFSYYLPVPAAVLLAVLGVSVLVWVVCLFMGTRLLKMVRTGDSLMLRKIRSSNPPDQG